MLTELPRVIAAKPDRPDLGEIAVHMGELTRRIAMDPDAWTPERVAQMLGFFDSQASGWSERDRPERHDALRDGLDRGGPFPDGVCLEVGAGTGNVTGDLQALFDRVVSIDLSRAMLLLAPPGAPSDPGRCVRAARTLGLGRRHRPRQHVLVPERDRTGPARGWGGGVGEHERRRHPDLPPAGRRVEGAAGGVERHERAGRMGNMADRQPADFAGRRRAQPIVFSLTLPIHILW